MRGTSRLITAVGVGAILAMAGCTQATQPAPETPSLVPSSSGAQSTSASISPIATPTAPSPSPTPTVTATGSALNPLEQRVADAYLKYHRVVSKVAAEPFRDSRPGLQTVSTGSLLYALDAAITIDHGKHQFDVDEFPGKVLSVHVLPKATTATVVACEDQSMASKYRWVSYRLDPTSHLAVVTKRRLINGPIAGPGPKITVSMELSGSTWRAAGATMTGTC